MTDWHRITVTDPERKLGICSVCGLGRLRRRERRGSVEWSCYRLYRAQQKPAPYYQKPHRRFVKDICERCGFVPVNPIQLDGHHRDHNSRNNTPENVETLCANCHRLEHLVIQ